MCRDATCQLTTHTSHLICRGAGRERRSHFTFPRRVSVSVAGPEVHNLGYLGRPLELAYLDALTMGAGRSQTAP
jgi:hypothetical protein